MYIILDDKIWAVDQEMYMTEHNAMVGTGNGNEYLAKWVRDNGTVVNVKYIDLDDRL